MWMGNNTVSSEADMPKLEKLYYQMMKEKQPFEVFNFFNQIFLSIFFIYVHFFLKIYKKICSKMKVFVKNQNLLQKSTFLPNVLSLNFFFKNKSFLQTSKCSSEMKIFVKNKTKIRQI